jgi:hypothetical protein
MGLFDFLNQGSKKPTMNPLEILALSEVIHNCSDLRTLIHIFNQKGDYDNPQISYDFGVAFFIKGDKVNAKKALIKGASFGLKFPCSYYDTLFIDAVGQCFMLLLTQFPLNDSDQIDSATSLSYIYLSRSIELSGIEAHDSLRSRAILFKDHEDPMAWQSLIMENLGMGVLVDPFLISDFYFAAQASGSPHKSGLQSAREIHQNLEDIAIGGKDADEYSLSEMAEIGKKRHLLLFKTLEDKFKKGKFNLTIEDLKNLNR